MIPKTPFDKPNSSDYKDYPLVSDLAENIDNVKNIMSQSSDLLVNEFTVGNTKLVLLCLEGMVSTGTLADMILYPMTTITLTPGEKPDSVTIYNHIKDNMLLGIDRLVTAKISDVIKRLMAGFAVIMVDGIASAFCYGAQGYNTRGVGEPSSEGNLRGSREGFVETVRTNMSMIRRRIKSPLLKFDLFQVSTKSNNDVVMCYMTDRVPKKLLADIKRKLLGMQMESVIESGYVEPYLNETKLSVFSGVSVTERPDVFTAKLLEGKIGVLIDGTPFSIVLPFLFIENFQTIDDYTSRPFYTTLVKLIRYLSFFISIFLPALYVAVINFHPELFNHTLLVTLAEAEEQSAFPLAIEAIIILLAYEIIRESSLRLPKSIGGGVSIIGGLIIGDTAVSAGIISNPILLVCAIAVIASFLIPNLYQPVAFLRIIAVIAGGVAGLYGIALFAAVLLINICSLESYGAPVTAPVSPFTARSMRDVLTRISMKSMVKDKITIEKLNGVNMK
ncbi:MAG: spore germination protein [Ruminococcus sp.]|jgi:spore germination protein KA|nr:spore germination protein [Ruminococcus sp.]